MLSDRVASQQASHYKALEEAGETPAAIKLLFGVVLMINLLINFDHGIFPPAIEQMKQDLSLDNQQIGMVGSLVYLGLVLGIHPLTPRLSVRNPGLPLL